MAIIEGQIESLKRLKDELQQNDIHRFKSIAQIQEFMRDYETEKERQSKLIENELDSEIRRTDNTLRQFKEKYNELRANVESKLKLEINKLSQSLGKILTTSKKNLCYRILYYPIAKYLAIQKARLEANFDKAIAKKAKSIANSIRKTKSLLDNYAYNREELISDRCLKSLRELTRIKDVIDSNQNLICGAIGENMVVKQVQKLSDEYYIFNDYTLELDPPIYNRRENDRIYSIQIDHLLVCKAGVFIIETKHWSMHSVQSLDLRSPVKQLQRYSYALFVLLNNQSQPKLGLHDHHWGCKQVPVRNLLVMTNAKPKEVFKHVKVLQLKDLNSYISYFDPVFSDTEVENISEFLRENWV